MKRFADGWTGLYVLVAAWAPVIWLVDSSRTRALWELQPYFFELCIGHDIARLILTLHALFITVWFGKLMQR